MSTAFSDFGPLTERHHAEMQRLQRRRVMVAFGIASVILILVAMGGLAVAYNASCSDDGSSSGNSDLKSSLLGVSKSIKAICAQTDYVDACEKSLANAANSSVASPVDIARASVAVISDAIDKAFGRSAMVTSDDPRVKAAVADCKEMYEDAKDDLERTLNGIDDGGVDGITNRGYQLRVWLSAVIANQETCIDGFPDGDLKKKMSHAMESGKEMTSNALAIIGKASSFLAALRIPDATSHRSLRENVLGEDVPELFSFVDKKNQAPLWVNRQQRRMLESKFKNNLTPNVTVAKDGSGKFKTINDALDAMPKKYNGRYVIYVKEGVYEEYVTITNKMVNVTMYGDGSRKTIISGKRNYVDGLTTFRTATFSAKGDGFMGIALGFRNTAGAAKHQAVALLVQSDRSIFFDCRMEGYQDTLYAHSKMQFYRNCVITGTIDFIFGDAAAVFQNCVLTFRRPLDNQKNIATAQGRADGREETGFVFQHCRLAAAPALRDASRPAIRSYLARPWREYSRTLIMDSFIHGFVDKAGYLPWNGDFALNTLWYAEYGNKGAGAAVEDRVKWPGYKKVISKAEANEFTVKNFLHAEPWIKPTGTPVKYGMWAS